jgi:hypothetical protein
MQLKELPLALYIGTRPAAKRKPGKRSLGHKPPIPRLRRDHPRTMGGKKLQFNSTLRSPH